MSGPLERLEIRTPRGRMSPALVFTVANPAGREFHLSPRQKQAETVLRSMASHKRHRTTVTAFGQAMGVGRGQASKYIRRLRSLSYIGAYRPTRGRIGGMTFWIPTPEAAARDGRERPVRWPSYGNDSTLTIGRVLTRVGLARSHAAMLRGRPPGSSGPPGGGASVPRSPRARGRPWPTGYIDEACPRRGHRGRLSRFRLAWSTSAGPDLGAVWAGRCSRCRRYHAVTLVLARPEPSRPARLDGRPPLPEAEVTPARIRSAREMIPALEPRHAEQLLVRYLGYRRQPLPELRIPPPHDGLELRPLLDAAILEATIDLARFGDARLLVPPD